MNTLWRTGRVPLYTKEWNVLFIFLTAIHHVWRPIATKTQYTQEKETVSLKLRVTRNRCQMWQCGSPRLRNCTGSYSVFATTQTPRCKSFKSFFTMWSTFWAVNQGAGKKFAMISPVFGYHKICMNHFSRLQGRRWTRQYRSHVLLLVH